MKGLVGPNEFILKEIHISCSSYLRPWRAGHLALKERISSLSKARVPKDLFKDWR